MPTNQTNTLETDSVSILEHSFTKSDMGRTLQCVVHHSAYQTGEEERRQIRVGDRGGGVYQVLGHMY